MFKLVVLYRRVEEEELLEKFFSETHLPLAEQLPGLVKSEVSRVKGKPGGESRFHLGYELYFESYDTFLAAMASQAGEEMITALQRWAKARLITWYQADVFEEEAGQRD